MSHVLQSLRFQFIHHWPRLLRHGTAAAAFGLLCGGLTPPQCVSAEPVYTNQGRFRIPYQLDPQEIQRIGAAEIQLHVSMDGGRTWKHVDSVPPVEGRFTFDAAADGDYTFAVRTIDKRGDAHPAGPLVPSLQVSVDTTPPQLQMDVAAGDGERVQVRWTAEDAHLDPASLKIEYRGNAGTWLAAPIAPSAQGDSTWPMTSGETVEVRGTVRDQAGNQATSSGRVTIPAVQKPAAAPTPPGRTHREPIAAASPTPAEPSASEQADNPAEQLPQIGSTPQVVNRMISSNPAEQPAITLSEVTNKEQAEGANKKQAAEEKNEPVAEAKSAQEPLEPADEHAVAARPPAEVPAEIANSHLPPLPEEPGGSVRHVNSTTFQIGYALDDVGPSGVSSVDLYLTENGGQKWFHYGPDLDRQSPIQVSVPAEGTYGFSLRVKSGAGLAMIPPQPGDAPELVVTVDRQPPQATFLPAQEAGGSPEHFHIRWAVTDSALPALPVTLSYSESKVGPWKSLCGWIGNTGQHNWHVGKNVPSKVYLRLDARDAAGNATHVVTETPVVIDLLQPTATFLDVDSVR